MDHFLSIDDVMLSKKWLTPFLRFYMRASWNLKTHIRNFTSQKKTLALPEQIFLWRKFRKSIINRTFKAKKVSLIGLLFKNKFSVLFLKRESIRSPVFISPMPHQKNTICHFAGHTFNRIMPGGGRANAVDIPLPMPHQKNTICHFTGHTISR